MTDLAPRPPSFSKPSRRRFSVASRLQRDQQPPPPPRPAGPVRTALPDLHTRAVAARCFDFRVPVQFASALDAELASRQLVACNELVVVAHNLVLATHYHQHQHPRQHPRQQPPPRPPPHPHAHEVGKGTGGEFPPSALDTARAVFRHTFALRLVARFVLGPQVLARALPAVLPPSHAGGKERAWVADVPGRVASVQAHIAACPELAGVERVAEEICGLDASASLLHDTLSSLDLHGVPTPPALAPGRVVGGGGNVDVECVRLGNALAESAAQCFASLVTQADPHAAGLNATPEAVEPACTDAVAHLVSQGLSWALRTVTGRVVGLVLVEGCAARPVSAVVEDDPVLGPVLGLHTHLRDEALSCVAARTGRRGEEIEEKATHVVFEGVADGAVARSDVWLALRHFAHAEARERGFKYCVQRAADDRACAVDIVHHEHATDTNEWAFQPSFSSGAPTFPFSALPPIRLRTQCCVLAGVDTPEQLFQRAFCFARLHSHVLASHVSGRLGALVLGALLKRATVANAPPGDPQRGEGEDEDEDEIDALERAQWAYLAERGVGAAQARELYVRLVTAMAPRWRQLLDSRVL